MTLGEAASRMTTEHSFPDYMMREGVECQEKKGMPPLLRKGRSLETFISEALRLTVVADMDGTYHRGWMKSKPGMTMA
jgi:hypothetical protein